MNARLNYDRVCQSICAHYTHIAHDFNQSFWLSCCNPVAMRLVNMTAIWFGPSILSYHYYGLCPFDANKLKVSSYAKYQIVTLFMQINTLNLF